jgi:hypothetical protein
MLKNTLLSMLPWRAGSARNQLFMWSCYLVCGYCYASLFVTPPFSFLWLICPWCLFALVNIIVTWVQFERSFKQVKTACGQLVLLERAADTGDTSELPGYLQEELAMVLAQKKLNGEIDY